MSKALSKVYPVISYAGNSSVMPKPLAKKLPSSQARHICQTVHCVHCGQCSHAVSSQPTCSSPDSPAVHHASLLPLLYCFVNSVDRRGQYFLFRLPAANRRVDRDPQKSHLLFVNPISRLSPHIGPEPYQRAGYARIHPPVLIISPVPNLPTSHINVCLCLPQTLDLNSPPPPPHHQTTTPPPNNTSPPFPRPSQSHNKSPRHQVSPPTRLPSHLALPTL